MGFGQYGGSVSFDGLWNMWMVIVMLVYIVEYIGDEYIVGFEFVCVVGEVGVCWCLGVQLIYYGCKMCGDGWVVRGGFGCYCKFFIGFFGMFGVIMSWCIGEFGGMFNVCRVLFMI